MAEIERCPSCGVPELIGRELRWEKGGVISLTDSPHNRMVILESNIIDNVFLGLEEMTGKPVEPLVVESRRRETRRFIERSFPFEVRNTLILGELSPSVRNSPWSKSMSESVLRIRRDLMERVINVARTFGYGDTVPAEEETPFPWRSLIMKEPYSLPLWKADVLGTVEAFEGLDMEVVSEKIDDITWLVRVFPGEHPVHLRGKLRRKRYPFREGDVELERCSSCGVPLDISEYRWDLKSGIIIASDTERRVAVFGPLAVEAVLDDLEAEYGSSIPRWVIEAQRRYLRKVVGTALVNRITTDLKRHLAKRGLGWLTGMEVNRKGMEMRVSNACLHLFIVGLAQVFFEIATGNENTGVEWELSGEGDLSVSVRAG